MPSKKWKIACISYNTNARRSENDQIYRLLNQEHVSQADIIAIGLQEISHSELFGAVPAEGTWLWSFSSWMGANRRPLLCKSALASNLLLIFARLEAFSAVEKIDARQSRSTLGGLTGHKGSASLRLLLKDRRALVFINSHFLPHPDGYTKRCQQYEYGRYCTFEDEASSSAQQYAVIWFGDMNWRVDSISSSELIKEISVADRNNSINELVEKVDQLRRAQRRKEAFSDFNEADINFHPTYKLMVGSTKYDVSRVPSWCDRILYIGQLRVDAYRSNRATTISDHLPVIAHFSFALSPSVAFSWNVFFEHTPRWYNVVPFTCRFSFTKNFWSRNGSYRDWVGIFPEEISNSLEPLNWLYLVTCYDASVGGRSLTVAEFPCLSPGKYRVGYFSVNKNCLQGISEPFEVEFLR